MPLKMHDVKPKIFKSPLAGLLVKVLVKDGDKVNAGQEILVIEAMKMENIIRADFDTIIKKVNKSQGDMLSSGDVILEFDNSEAK